MQRSVSVTTDDGTLLRVPLTPALLRVPLPPTKRLSSDELGDEAMSCDISPAKVSFNKLARPSAIE